MTVMARITVGSTKPLRFVMRLTTQRYSRRKRITLISVSRSDVGVLETLSAKREGDASDGGGISRYRSKRVVVREHQPVRSGRSKRTRELFIGGRGTDLTPQPPTIVEQVFCILYATETPK